MKTFAPAIASRRLDHAPVADQRGLITIPEDLVESYGTKTATPLDSVIGKIHGANFVFASGRANRAIHKPINPSSGQVRDISAASIYQTIATLNTAGESPTAVLNVDFNSVNLAQNWNQACSRVLAAFTRIMLDRNLLQESFSLANIFSRNDPNEKLMRTLERVMIGDAQPENAKRVLSSFGLETNMQGNEFVSALYLNTLPRRMMEYFNVLAKISLHQEDERNIRPGHVQVLFKLDSEAAQAGQSGFFGIPGLKVILPPAFGAQNDVAALELVEHRATILFGRRFDPLYMDITAPVAVVREK